ncbi:YEATS domain-containing protein 2 isoform X2 [Ambystoma mexicanum]|uniref:YEATS domain-containing protein 2 isoform X2 n=1 Tax=Ambystoma mexicanum TaxID=8296 RepID=UPI0037E73698
MKFRLHTCKRDLNMSGMKRAIEDKDPDYDDITITHPSKRHKPSERTSCDATVQKIEGIIKDQFTDEIKNKEHEIEVINQRLIDARKMMDKLRACIVANYYASAGLHKEGPRSCDQMVFNHPSIKKFLESPSRSSSPVNQPSESLSANYSETDLLSQHNELYLNKDSGNVEMRERSSNAVEQRPARLGGQDSESLRTFAKMTNRNTSFRSGDDTSRLYVKKTIVVGNVSKYIPPDKREENDQSTHKWMVYVRGSQKEPSIHHFVKKVWFFLHPSYKPNDLVEVSEPPFHLTRRGWGEFPVRVQIHFKDSQNKRIDIIHNLKLDRTYTGLQTLGAETVVDVELHRHSLGEDYLFSQSSESHFSDTSASLPVPSPVKTSSPVKQAHESITTMSVVKGYSIGARDDQPTTFHPLQAVLERTPTKITSPKIRLGSHSNSAFQPITASCKIISQAQIPSAAESPGKSFQPITMSCKIVSGSPTSKHLGTSLTGRGSSSPVPKLHGSSFLTSSVKEDSFFATMPPLCPIGSHTKVQNAKSVTGGLGAFTKVIIKQEPGEPSLCPQTGTGTASQPTLQQYVTVKGNHVVSVMPQKPVTGIGEVSSTTAKVVGIPIGSTVHSTVKPAMAVSGGQILVAKSVSSVGKVTGQKPAVAQGVAKAIVSGGGGTIVAQPLQTLTKAPAASSGAQKAGSQGSVMATLQLPATNLANLANLPPGTKLYLTTNSKNPSGKGKLLLIPQGAILRATNNSGLQPSSSGSTAGGTQTTSTSLSQQLTYTSYILKQTPQGTFLVGQPSAQSSVKQVTQNAIVQSGSGVSSTPGQPALKVVSGQKATILTQAAGGPTTLTKIPDSSLKSLATPSTLSRAGTTMLRLTGGVITATTTSAANGVAAQQAEGAHSSSSSVVTSAAKVSGQQQHVFVNQVQSGSSVASKPGIATVVSASSLISAASVVSGRTQTPGLLKIHSNQSSPQKALLTIPTSQIKQLGGTASSTGVQTMLIPVNKVVQSVQTCKLPPAVSTASTTVACPTLTTVAKVKKEPETTVQISSYSSICPVSSAIVKTEESTDLKNYCISTEYLENSQQLLTTVVKNIPLVTEKSEDVEPFCAKSVEQYYSWNIGKRRAAEWQRAVRVRKVLREIIEKNPKFNSVNLLTTKHIVYWCRHHGYTPPDLESLRDEEESIEDVLTQIDSEPECLSSYSTAESICRKIEDLQMILKKEPEHDEDVDIVNVTEPLKVSIKKEEKAEDVKFFLESTPTSEFISDTAQKIGVCFQPVEVEKNVYASAVEDMIVKATEQLVSDILREAFAMGYQTAPHNRTPKEITVMNIHRAICNIPTMDFLSNKHMGVLNVEQ